MVSRRWPRTHQSRSSLSVVRGSVAARAAAGVVVAAVAVGEVLGRAAAAEATGHTRATVKGFTSTQHISPPSEVLTPLRYSAVAHVLTSLRCIERTKGCGPALPPSGRGTRQHHRKYVRSSRRSARSRRTYPSSLWQQELHPHVKLRGPAWRSAVGVATTPKPGMRRIALSTRTSEPALFRTRSHAYRTQTRCTPHPGIDTRASQWS